MSEIVKAKLDVVFKKLFTSDNDVLKAFVGDILDIPLDSIQEIQVINPNLLPAAAEGKQSQLDLNMTVDDKLVNVEIQLQNKGHYEDRALYYWAKLYSDQLQKGNKYGELKKTITINILNFNLFKETDSPYSRFSLLENSRHQLLTDKCSINFFELVKLDKTVDKNNRKQLWLQLINAETEEELTMLKETGVPEIEKAVVILHKMSADEEMKEIARLREKTLLDEESAKDYYLSLGEARGEVKGEAKKEAEIIKKLLKSGMTEEQIQKILNS